MENSRIFVRNLPTTINEDELRKHFSTEDHVMTDMKLIPHRRIAFIGFVSAQQAAQALKLNRTYIRMSRIEVTAAKPITDSTRRGKKTDPHGTKTAPLQTVESSGGKRKLDAVDEADPKLAEFLQVMHPGKKSKSVLDDAMEPFMAALPTQGESDDEYEHMPSRPTKRPQPIENKKLDAGSGMVTELARPQASPESARQAPVVQADAGDDEWLRSRQNRLLDLMDPDDAEFKSQVPIRKAERKGQTITKQVEQDTAADKNSHAAAGIKQGDKDQAVALIRKTSRLYIRNLAYQVGEDAIRDYFQTFGPLKEVHLAADEKGSKGFAHVHFDEADDAVSAFQAADGTVFKGRILHILPGSAKREVKLDEFALSKVPIKKQKLIRKKAQAASSTFNWNSLFLNQDAVNTAVAARLGISKAAFLDPSASENMVKQAIAETQVIQEAKTYFAAHGVDLAAFQSQERGDTTILVKNLPHGSVEEVRKLFEEQGTVLRFLSPPSGTLAVVQFGQALQARAAFSRLAYRRIRDSVLFLEKGPKNMFQHAPRAAPMPADDAGRSKQAELVSQLREGGTDDGAETSSLYVSNLNFVTTTTGLAEAFKALDGFVSARVKTKQDPKRAGQVLSMGFGFVAFRSKTQAQKAQQIMDGSRLDGHALAVKASHRAVDAAEERRHEDQARRKIGHQSKIVIKNLAFEATRADVMGLFGTYGALRTVRVPKKFNKASRGFAFADFVRPQEAEKAFAALKDTHLLGRRLVLEFAAAEEMDAEAEMAKLQKKTGRQVVKVGLQRLAGSARTKLHLADGREDGEGC